MAKEIKKLSDYDSKKPVRLNICEAGKGDDSHAREVSKLLPNPVMGSTTDVVSNIYHENGKAVSTDKTMHPVNGGQWRTFEKGNEIKLQPTPPPPMLRK